jgi:O-antigen/teichoic acid export membrane protein
VGLRLPGPIGRAGVLNLVGAAMPAVLGVALLPTITGRLGLELFGLLSLALITLEYASMFALGLGPATTRYVAEDVERGNGTALRIVRWSVLAQIVLGTVAGLLLAAVAPLLVSAAFNLTGDVAREAIVVFRLVGVLIPVTLAFAGLLGALEGARRFGYSNALRIPVASATFGVPAALLVWWGVTSVAEIVVGLIVVRLAGVVVAAAVVRAVLPPAVGRVDAGAMRRLLTFGAWVTVSNVANPVLTYGERYMLGMRIGLPAAGVYSAPFDALFRLLIVPGSLTRALFPSLAAAGARDDMEALRRLFRRAVVWVAVMMSPLLLVAGAFAPAILEVWLGPEFSAGAGTAMRVLSLGVLLNSLAQVPVTLLVATGRPQVPARLHLIEAAFYVPMAWWLVGNFGVTGAAVAWTTRVAVDTLLLFIAAGRMLRRSSPAA